MILYIIVPEKATKGVLQKMEFLKFLQISQETPVLEYLFNKVSSLPICNFIEKKLQQVRFVVKFAKFLRAHSQVRDNFWLVKIL